jgi:hypothetical protein
MDGLGSYSLGAAAQPEELHESGITYEELAHTIGLNEKIPGKTWKQTVHNHYDTGLSRARIEAANAAANPDPNEGRVVSTRPPAPVINEEDRYKEIANEKGIPKLPDKTWRQSVKAYYRKGGKSNKIVKKKLTKYTHLIPNYKPKRIPSKRRLRKLASKSRKKFN